MIFIYDKVVIQSYQPRRQGRILRGKMIQYPFNTCMKHKLCDNNYNFVVPDFQLSIIAYI